MDEEAFAESNAKAPAGQKWPNRSFLIGILQMLPR
jgi:hypothetical protein